MNHSDDSGIRASKFAAQYNRAHTRVCFHISLLHAFQQRGVNAKFSTKITYFEWETYRNEHLPDDVMWK